jgi:hypothetical protein
VAKAAVAITTGAADTEAVTAPGPDPRHPGLLYRDSRGEHLVLAVNTVDPSRRVVVTEIATENIHDAVVESHEQPWDPANEVVERAPTSYEMALVGASFEAWQRGLALTTEEVHRLARSLDAESIADHQCRHLIRPHDESLRVYVGWDGTLDTYFLQVGPPESEQSAEIDGERMTEPRGNEWQELPTLEALVEAVAPYATLTLTAESHLRATAERWHDDHSDQDSGPLLEPLAHLRSPETEQQAHRYEDYRPS